MGPFRPHGQNHQGTTRNTWYFEGPRHPKKWKRTTFSILGNMSGKHDFSTLERKKAEIGFPAFWGAGDLQNTKYSLRIIDGFTRGGENDPFY